MATIGIDLGTWNSAAAWASPDGQLRMLKSEWGPTRQGIVFPSFVRFDDAGKAVRFGEDARRDLPDAPEYVLWGTKRLIGRPYPEIASELVRFGYKTAPAPDGNVLLRVGSTDLRPEDVAGELLGWIRQSADNRSRHPFIDGPVDRAVVTHPAYFDDSQIKRTREAALDRGGFREVLTIAEPVAAALAYGVGIDPGDGKFIAAIDWGAGTLDIATVVLRSVRSGSPVIDEIKPARGDVALGGLDMDDELIRAAVDKFNLDALAAIIPPPPGDRSVIPIRHNVDADTHADMGSLRSTIEEAKIQLSKRPTYEGYSNYKGSSVAIRVARSRNEARTAKWSEPYIVLEEELEDILQKFQTHLRFAVQQSGVPVEQFDHVILIGGPMHMPCVRHRVREVFGANRNVVEEIDRIATHGFPVDPMEAVARGAALHGRGTGVTVREERLPFAYGVALGPVGSEVGRVLVEVGGVVGQEYPKDDPFELNVGGSPGDPIPLGLFKREDLPDQQKHTRMGEFLFVPTYKNGESGFRLALDVARDRTLTLKVVDLFRADKSQPPLLLDRLDKLSGEEINPPERIGAKRRAAADSTEEYGRPAPPPMLMDTDVSALKVEATRKRAAQYLKVADLVIGQLPAGTANRDRIQRDKENVRQLLARIPENQKVRQDLYIELMHGTEFLKLSLDASRSDIPPNLAILIFGR